MARHPAALSHHPRTIAIMSYSPADSRARLLDIINRDAVQHGDFVLASGARSTFYVDMRQVTLSSEGSHLVGDVMLDLLIDHGYAPGRISAVGGLTLGADPIALAIMYAAARRNLTLDSFVVRKASKDHGMQRLVEGKNVRGRRVAVLEDTSSTGASALTAVEHLRREGAITPVVATIINRSSVAREAVTGAGLDYLAAFDIHELDISEPITN